MNQEIVMSEKKKWYRRKIFYIIMAIVLLIAVVVYGQVKKTSQGPQYETTTVGRGTLVQTVDATGNVESANELELRFEQGGLVGRVYKQVNDEVKAGDILVELNLSELNARVAQASANVRKAQADLDKALAGNTDEYINNMEAKLRKAEADLEQVKINYEGSISDAESALETAENNLELSEGSEQSQIVQDAYNDMVALLYTVQDTLAEGLVEADNILGIDNTLANDDFESVLSIQDDSKLNNAKTKYLLAKAAKVDTDDLINVLVIDSNHDQIDWAADTAEEALFAMKELLFSVSGVLNSTVPVGDLSQVELDSMKTSIQTVRSGVSANYASLINYSQSIDTAKNSYKTNQIVYDKAKSDLENIKNISKADITAYEALMEQARANLEDAKNPPREVDVAGYRASLLSARASLSQTVASRNKARIIAPLDGVVGKVEAKVGEYVSSQDIVVKLVSPHFEIKVDIPETDIVKISLNDNATIKIDAYGDDVEFVGQVMEVEKGETVIQDVIYYTVTLSLEDNEEYEILNGMTASVVFYTEEKENVLYVPQRGVRTGEDGRYVRILENEAVKDVPVKIGLRGDNGLIEIVEGLQEGQEIVISVIESAN